MATQQQIYDIKRENPSLWLQQLGYIVKGKGRNIEVFEQGNEKEIYRITQKPDGKWISCDRQANGIGDNIALYQHATGAGFSQALQALAGAEVVKAKEKTTQIVEQKYPSMPRSTANDRIAGRDYLKNLGIDHQVLDRAEEQGFLKYTKDRVMYVGKDTKGNVRNVTTRAIRDDIDVPKRDLANTDKSHPQVLQGKSSTLWIVEGGKDALAVHTLAKMHNKDSPTVIVTGGVGTKSCFENPAIRNLIAKSERIVYALENESTQEKQIETDKRRQVQLDLIASAKRADVQIEKWQPAHAKDVADFLHEIHKARQLERGKERGGLTRNCF